LVTVASGFSNQGVIELTSSGGFSSQLTVSSGTLTNAPGASIRVLTTGTRTLTAQLDNQGTLELQNALTINKSSADHANSGTIAISGGNLTLTQSGTTPSFTNTGTIDIGSGRTFAISAGSLNFNGGALTGSGTLTLSSVTVNLGADLSNATVGAVTLTSSTVNGPGTLTNAVGRTLPITSSTINAALLNEGTLLTHISGALNGAISTTPGSILRVGSSTHTLVTVASGFSNQGVIELTSSGGFSSQLTVSSGTLTNAPGASIRVLTTGTRTLTAQLDNQGTLDLQNALTINKSSADHSNSGTINITGGNLTVSQSGTTPSFTNTGVIDVAVDRTFTISAGGLTNNGSGILTGHPAGSFAISGNLVGQTSNADRFAPLGTVRLTGPGSAANPQLLEVLGQDRGSGAPGFTNNFVLGTLTFGGTYVRLVDNADNSSGAGPEALYVNSLVVPSGTTLDLNSFHLYARQVQIDGTVLGGTITLVPDGGTIVLNAPSAGAIAVSGEIDEWTFFGRSGRAVTVVANPGTTGAPAALSPTLNFADVRLLDPSGAVIASGISATSGQIVTLLGVELPADGTYRVQVQAAPGGDRGNYVLAVWNATVDTRPLVFNQQTSGVLETPYSADRWTFTAAANDQVMFDWVNAAPPSIMFTLTGPDGFVGFSGLTGDSGMVNLPADGAYVLESSAGTAGSYAFRLVETSQTELTLGTPHAGNLVGSGQAQLFRVTIAAGQQFRVVLDDSAAGNRNELYARLGAPPTRADFQYRATAASADQELFVPNAAPGTWYLMLYSPAVPAPGTFTLTATANDIFLDGVTPDRHGNGTDMVLTLTGAGFDRSTVVELVDSGGTVYAAGSVSIDLPTQVTATFAAGSVPPGTYAVRARRVSGGSAELPGAFEVLVGGQPQLETNLVLPSVVGRHGLATIYVEYANTGSAAMPAPLLVLRGSDRALLTLNEHRLVQGFWTSAVPDGFTEPDADGISTIQILGSGATPGVLQPGEHVRVPVYYAGLLQPWDFSDSSVDFDLAALGPDDTTLIDWPSLEAALQPPGIPADAWAPVYTNLITQIGSTWGDYARMLADNAQYLGRLGQRVLDVSQLWAFEVEQAVSRSPLGSPAGATDMRIDAPGLPITFGRVFASNLVGRYGQGPLGRGWTWANGWQRSLTVEADGTAVVSGIDGGQRRFEPDSRRAGTYFSQPGDHAMLTALGGGVFLLREPDGLVTRFRSDGRVDYVEDPNGNRVTATWTGTQLTRLTHSAGQFLDIIYDAGQIASLTDQIGRTVVYTYDPSGEHLLSVQGIDGQTTRYTYSTGAGAAREHALLSVEYPDGTHEFFAYDPRGRLGSAALDGDAERFTFSYDSAGRVTATDALGGATGYFFDHQGRLAAVEDPLGRRTILGYDSEFNLTRVTDPLGQNYLYQYDGRGNLVRSTDPLGQVTAFTYTAAFNRLASVIDARGNPLRYGYDSRGNLTSITYADGSADRFVVDARGEIDTWTNRRGQLIDYQVDADGRFERRELPDGSFVEYRYNARGNLEQAIDATGTTQFEYLDPQNPDLPTRITYPGGRFLEYTYDNGRRTRMVDQDGFTVNYLYDAAGRLEFLRDAAGDLIVQYHYDAAGRLQREDHGNGTFTEYQYDAASQLEHLIHRAPDGAVNSRFDYVYDDLGRRTRMTTLDGVWDYTYDGIGQLTRAVFTSNDTGTIPHQDLEYAYDAAGNRTRTIINGVTTDYLANNLNQYTQVGTATLTFDLDGNLVSRSDGGITTTYAYDALNRLTGVTLPGAAWAYEYDALDNRSATVHNGQRTAYLIDPFGLGDVVGEYSAGGPGAPGIARYTHGLDLTSRVDSSGVAAYYDFDGNGNTAQLTGTGGTVLNTYRYLPFGVPLAVAETVLNPFTYVGQFGVTDGDQGLYFMRQRWYDPDQGRFLTADPIGLTSGDVNLYRYVSNDPTNQVDPSGLLTEENCFKLEGIFVKPPSGGDTACVFTPNEPADCQEWGGAYYEKISNCIVPIDPNSPECDQSFETVYDELEEVIAKAVIIRCRPKPPAPSPPPSRPPKPPANALCLFISDAFCDRDVAGSLDPNEKTGPGGFGPDHFIAPESALPYRIDFENEASATAPAQRVVITDELDADLDWDTFAWTEVGFGDVLVTVPSGSQHFQTTVDVTYNDRAFQVEIELELDLQTGLLTAVFQSIDPATSLPPDVLTGFLPPEDGTGRGQGYISYTSQPRPDLATGTQIRNIALITFDVNEPIATNQVDPHDPSQGTDPQKEALNTIDAGIPTSSVDPLPAVTSTSSFTVSWSGADDPGGSGIALFDVFVSDNGGPFTAFLLATTQTAATFIGQDEHTYGFYSVATDGVGHRQPTPTGAQASTLVRADEAPVAEANGPYSVAEGGSVVLSSSGSSDPDNIALYEWDFDYDGATFDSDATGASPTFSAAALDGPSTRTVALRVTDDLGASSIDTTTITINNVSPTASVGGDDVGVPGQTRSFFVSATDPSPVDVAAGFTFSVAFGDGDTLVIHPGEALTLSHTYLATGTFTVTVTASDKDGGVSDPATHAIVIEPAGVQPDPLDPDCTALFAGGTSGNDSIQLSPGASAGTIEVFIEGVSQGTFSPTCRLVVYGMAGDDDIQVDGGVSLPAWFYGDGGNDRLKGGAGHDVLLGGFGDDLLIGGSGRDLMIGGRGADRLIGNNGDDMLIAAFTDYDAIDSALMAIVAEWTSARDYDTRVRNLSDGSGSADRLNGDVFLNAETVHDDDSADLLTGAAGRDWFFANSLQDAITDLGAGEVDTSLT
jgi:RHS repeat-associated protein